MPSLAQILHAATLELQAAACMHCGSEHHGSQGCPHRDIGHQPTRPTLDDLALAFARADVAFARAFDARSPDCADRARDRDLAKLAYLAAKNRHLPELVETEWLASGLVRCDLQDAEGLVESIVVRVVVLPDEPVDVMRFGPDIQISLEGEASDAAKRWLAAHEHELVDDYERFGAREAVWS